MLLSRRNSSSIVMAVEQNLTLQEAETAIKAGRISEGERILKQILESSEGKIAFTDSFACISSQSSRSQVKGRKKH